MTEAAIQIRRQYDQIFNLYTRIIENYHREGVSLEAIVTELEVRLFRANACLEAIQKVYTSGILDVPYVWSNENETLMDQLGIVNGPSIKYLTQTLPQDIVLLQIELDEYRALLAAADKDAHVLSLKQVQIAAGEHFLAYAKQCPKGQVE